MSGEVLLGYVTGGWNRDEFMDSIIVSILSDDAVGGYIKVNPGPLLVLGRNLLTSQFLGRDQEWLMMVDTDIVFKKDAVSRLLASADPVERPIMSGLYHIFEKGKKVPAVYANEGSEPSELELVPYDSPDEDIVAQAFAVGAGFLLVHRSVFEKIRDMSEGQASWFREIVVNGRDFGEDISFCLRANVAGFPIHVNTGVRVGHIKSAMLGEVT
jgi:GT2 family glycosyltransferase